MQRAEHVSRRLKLRHLNVLMAVARCGSMAKAAEHLAVSQPVVSKAIAELEQILGVRLLDRGPHGVEPTAHGRALLNRSAAIFDDLRTSVSELEFLSDPTAGELRIGCEENLATGLLPALIDRLAGRYPRIEFAMVIADPNGAGSEGAHRRDCHHANGSAPRRRGVRATKLYDDRLWVVAGARHALLRRKKIRLADLVEERWCLPPPDHPVGALVIEAFRRSGLEPPRRSVTVGSAQCTSNLVAKGHFLGVHGSMFLRFTPPSVRLKVLPVELPIPSSSTSIVTLRHRTLSPVAQLFINYAREVTQPLGDRK
jgi:DNA-binding transcriptional LysR family regulator